MRRPWGVDSQRKHRLVSYSKRKNLQDQQEKQAAADKKWQDKYDNIEKNSLSEGLGGTCIVFGGIALLATAVFLFLVVLPIILTIEAGARVAVGTCVTGPLWITLAMLFMSRR